MPLHNFINNKKLNTTFKIIWTILLYYVFFSWRIYFQKKYKLSKTVQKVGVVGAGSSGLITAKQLQEKGFNVTVFESTDNVGGLWNVPHIKAANPAQYQSPAWSGLRSNTSTILTHFHGFDINCEESTNIPAKKIHKYLEDFSQQNNLNIRFQHKVIKVERDNEKWVVHYNFGSIIKSDYFDAIAICCGISWKPFMPSIAGMETFTGQVFHSADYQNNEEFKDKNCLVIGLGTSACDIATDIAQVAKRADVYARQARRMMPVVGHNNVPTLNYMTLASYLQFLVYQKLSFIPYFKRKSYYNFWKVPGVDVLEESGSVLYRKEFRQLVENKTIALMGGPSISIDKNKVYFSGNHSKEYDCIILATGFKPHLPFIQMDLYENKFLDVFSCKDSTLCFVGMTQRVPGQFLHAEIQAMLVAAYWSRQIALPVPERTKEVGGAFNFIGYYEQIAAHLGLALHNMGLGKIKTLLFSTYGIHRFYKDN